jgi:hypothetical protein
MVPDEADFFGGRKHLSDIACVLRFRVPVFTGGRDLLLQITLLVPQSLHWIDQRGTLSWYVGS